MKSNTDIASFFFVYKLCDKFLTQTRLVDRFYDSVAHVF